MAGMILSKLKALQGGIGLAACLVVTACATTGAKSQDPVRDELAGRSGTIKIEGNMLDMADKPGTPARLLDHVATLLRQHRYASAGHYIRLYPERAVASAVNPDLSASQQAPRRFIATQLDAMFGLEGGGWLALMSNSKALNRYRTAYKALLRFGRKGDDAAFLSAISHLAPEHESPTAYLLRQYGSMLLAVPLPGKAANVLEMGAKLESAGDWEIVRLRLLLAVAYAQQGKLDRAGAAWYQSVLRAGMFLGAHEKISSDPAYWTQAIQQRPANAGWPGTAVAVMKARIGIGRDAPGPPEAFVWGYIGRLHLDRGKHLDALRIMKKAEAMLTNISAIAWLRLGQAAALLGMGQSDAAMGVVAELMQVQERDFAPAALALFGSMLFRSGKVKRGIAYLQKAKVDESFNDWPGKGRRAAELALAYLVIGEKDKGLSLLHRAQAYFANNSATGDLLLSLDNEASFFEQLGDHEKVNALRSRISELEKQARPLV